MAKTGVSKVPLRILRLFLAKQSIDERVVDTRDVGHAIDARISLIRGTFDTHYTIQRLPFFGWQGNPFSSRYETSVSLIRETLALQYKR